MHPYQQHTTHFQIIAVAADPELGPTVEELEALATVAIKETPPLYYSINYTVRFRPPFEERIIYIVYYICFFLSVHF